MTQAVLRVSQPLYVRWPDGRLGLAAEAVVGELLDVLALVRGPEDFMAHVRPPDFPEAFAVVPVRHLSLVGAPVPF